MGLNGRLRSGIIVFLLLIITACACGLLWNNLLRPKTVTEKVKVYSYRQAAQLDYQVNLLPNNFFPLSTLGPGQAYITSLTDTLQTRLDYTLLGERKADISGTYQVNGTLAAYSEMGKDTEKEVWRRDLSFLNPQKFQAQNNKVHIQESVSIPVMSYAVFAESLQEATKFSPSRLELKIEYIIKVQGQTDQGAFADELRPTLIVPLQGKVFAVEGELSPQKEGAIEADTVRPAAGIQSANIWLGLALLLAVISCLLFIRFTNRLDKYLAPEEKKLGQILRQFGERVVFLASSAPWSKFEQVLMVGDFEDLVKAADEIEQPILYEVNELQGRHNFYVVSDPYIYLYTLLINDRINQEHRDIVSTDRAPAL